MPTVAKEILGEARSTFLNDPNATEATDEKFLPYLRLAYTYLEGELQANGAQSVNSEEVKTIPANVDEYLPLPTDLVIPRTILEREAGTTDEYREISYRNNIPSVTPGPFLEYWTYRLDRIFFLPATTAREVKLIYQNSYPAVLDPNSNLLGKAETYLIAKSAALYLLFVRQSPTLAEQANNVAESELAEIVNAQVKLQQSRPVRRKGYQPFRTS